MTEAEQEQNVAEPQPEAAANPEPAPVEETKTESQQPEQAAPETVNLDAVNGMLRLNKSALVELKSLAVPAPAIHNVI